MTIVLSRGSPSFSVYVLKQLSPSPQAFVHRLVSSSLHFSGASSNSQVLVCISLPLGFFFPPCYFFGQVCFCTWACFQLTAMRIWIFGKIFMLYRKFKGVEFAFFSVLHFISIHRIWFCFTFFFCKFVQMSCCIVIAKAQFSLGFRSQWTSCQSNRADWGLGW